MATDKLDRIRVVDGQGRRSSDTAGAVAASGAAKIAPSERSEGGSSGLLVWLLLYLSAAAVGGAGTAWLLTGSGS